eukprot:3497505-Prymnesium_polylepis.1
MRFTCVSSPLSYKYTPASEAGDSDCACARGVMFEVAVCNVRALALSVAHSRPCASVVVLS